MTILFDDFRSLIKVGSSLAITIPSKMCESMTLDETFHVQVRLCEDERGRFIEIFKVKLVVV